MGRASSVLHDHVHLPEPGEEGVFISYAEPDTPLAQALVNLLGELRIDCYYAPTSVPEGASSNWPQEIINKGIRRSNCFIFVCSPNSLSRPWVLFELGAAAGFRKKCLYACVQGIRDAEIESIPHVGQYYHFRLNKEVELAALLAHVGHAMREDENVFRVKINRLFTHPRKPLQDVMSLSAQRWVFIAGNAPKPKQRFAPAARMRLRVFVRSLTEELLQKEFSIAACPQVTAVGKIALDTAQASAAVRGGHVDYEIGGLYPVDREVRKNPMGTRRAQSKWQEHLIAFRKSYLEKHEWLVLIGGADGTKEEHEAFDGVNKVRHKQDRIYPIPCFGGYARELFEKMRHSRPALLMPCTECMKQKNTTGGCLRIREIVDKMANA
jgi:hypothetical protein